MTDFERFEVAGPAGRITGWRSKGTAPAEPLPVLFLHPINLQGACWLDVASALEPQRFCVMPDYRGHGGSDPKGPFGVEHYVADALAALDGAGVGRAHLAGGSLGGPIAVAFAVLHPERVASIAAFGSALAIEGEGLGAVIDSLRENGVRAMFREVIPKISVAPGTEQAVIDEILAIANPNDVETVVEIWSTTIRSDVRPYVDRVDVPALVVTGEHDLTCTPAQGEAMAAGLKTELVTMPGVGHLPMHEAPHETARILSRHFAAHEHPSPVLEHRSSV